MGSAWHVVLEVQPRRKCVSQRRRALSCVSKKDVFNTGFGSSRQDLTPSSARAFRVAQYRQHLFAHGHVQLL